MENMKPDLKELRYERVDLIQLGHDEAETSGVIF
jgi:hypothetical protein